jgi:hypothetical protein
MKWVWCHHYHYRYHHSIFTDEKIEAYETKEIPKVTHLVCRRAGIQDLIVLTLNLQSALMCVSLLRIKVVSLG